MSKIGKIPIEIPEGVTVSYEKNLVTVTGPKGGLDFTLPSGVVLTRGEKQIFLKPKDQEKKANALVGLARAILANMIKGVSEGFRKTLELSGVGFRAQVQGEELTLSVGFSHPVKINAPQGVSFAVSEGKITVSGIDKKLVGEVAAKIRQIRPAEPYKGKGIKYEGEKIRKKAGKAAKAVGVGGR